MEHTDMNKIFNKKGKKVTAIFVSGALIATGVAAAIFKGDSVSNNPETKIETTVEDSLNSLLILTEDFDINDKEAVNKRAKAIYDISEKEYEVVDIANMIYILGEKYDSITYPSSAKTDKEKFEYLQSLALLLGKMLDDGLYEYTDALVNDEIILEKEKTVPCAYMFMSSTTDGKKKAIEVAKIYYKQRDNVKNNDVAAMETTAVKYYDLYKSLEDMELSASDKVALYEQFSAINPLFTSYLKETQVEELDDALGKVSTSTNIIFQTAAQNLNISEILDDRDFGKDTTPLGEAYNSSDAVVANNHSAVKEDNKNSITKVVEEGGKTVSGSSGKQEVINTPTTKVEKETFVVEHPTQGTTVITVPGNTVVEEETFVVNVDNYVGTTVVYEEGGDIVEGRFVDADKVSDKNLSNTYTLG